MRKARQLGFTLMELMIAVAIVGILLAVALPSYQSAMVKNRRASAQALLSDIAQREQQYLMDARAYTDNKDTLKVVVPQDVSKFYDVAITVSASLPPAYTATATPKDGSSQVADGALSITSNGTKLPAGKW